MGMERRMNEDHASTGPIEANEGSDELSERLDDVDGSAYYYGTREAFERSGLIPSGLAFPGDMPGMKGARWYGLDQRRYSMSKWYRPKGTFRLEVRLPQNEVARLRHDRERAAKLAKIDKALVEANVSEASYRADVARFALIGRAAFNGELQGPHGWAYEGAVVSEVNALFDEIGELLRTGGVRRDLSARDRLQAQRAAISDQGLQRFLCEVQK